MTHYTHATIVTKYIIGYTTSFLLTSVSFGTVWLTITQDVPLQTWQIIAIVFTFAVIQLFIQLILFLHLGEEKKPRWNLFSFLFMSLVVIIVVVGSLWIMANLNYRMMSPDTLEKQIDKASTSGF
jgi:cytochrome o ubiquinol oxidase subunit IV